MKSTTARFVTCNLYLSGNLVRLALKVVMQNDRKFMVMFLLQTHLCFSLISGNILINMRAWLVV